MNHHWPGVTDVQGMSHNLLGSVSKTDETCRPSTDRSWETTTEGKPMHLPPDLPVAGPAAVIQWLQAKGSLTFTGQPQTVAGLRTAEERRKAAALAFLGKEAMALEMHPVTLSFREPKLEAEFLNNVAVRRRYVLMFIMCFDVLCYLFRLLAKYVKNKASETSEAGSVLSSLMPQLLNMAFLYVFLGLLNWRSRRLGNGAARQEELLLSGIMALAICNLLATLRPSNAQDYVFAAMFLMCTSTFLKIRWLVGTVILTLPLVLVFAWPRTRALLPADAEVHLTVSWAVGSLMSFLADSWRRQMFANHKLASAAAEKELQEAQARATVQQQLAAAQAQAAHRALTVAREKAANEAKSEFMSLMCHEVRTPLNGCLASAEMLLETPLQDEQRELAKTICVSGSILLSTVSNFLDFFKMEAGKQLDVVRSEINIKELVNDIHCIIEAMIGRESDVKLLRPSTEAVPEFVMGDPDRLKGVLLNLYTNAAKFTKEGTISLRVRVAGPHYRPTPHDLTTFAGGTAPCQGGSQTSSVQPGLGPRPANGAPSAAERQQQQRQAPPPPLQGRRQGFIAVSERLPQMQQQPVSQQQPVVSKAAQSRAAAALLKGGAGSRRSSVTSSRSSGGHSEHSLDAFFREPAALANSCDGHLRGSAPSQAKQPYQEVCCSPPVQSFAGASHDPLHKTQGPGSAFSCPEAARAERIASRQASTNASEAALSADGASPAGEEMPGSKLQAALAHSQTNGLSHGAKVAEASQEAKEQRRALSDGLLRSAMAHKKSLDSSVPPKKLQTTSFEEVAPSVCNGKTPFSAQAVEPFTEEDEDDLEDASESDVDRARPSNSAPDVSEERQSSVPCRKSFSSPADVMDAASIAAVSALVAEGRLPGRGTSMSTTRKATLGRGMECKVEPLGRGWFNAVATQPPSSQRGTSSSSTHSSTDRRKASPGERQQQQWLVFEVSDSGCGIGEAGLRSLFKDYVQGTEDEMRRPRSRGGTGLGLSICSKQVAVLGGHIGAMSKLNTGSTFWFTVPLLLPEHSPRRSITLRRTASWGSRNAFSDGHISDFDQAATLPGRMNRAVTRPHQYRRQSHQLARSGTWLDQQGSQVRRSQQLTRGALAQQERHSQDGSMQGRSTSEPEQTHQSSMDRSPPRRRSAPEAPANIAAIRLAAYKGQLDAAAAAASAAAEAAQVATPLQQGTSSQARAAVARAVLCTPAKPDDLSVPRRSISRDLLRSSLSMEPVQGGVPDSDSDRSILQEGMSGNGPLAEYLPPEMLGPHYAAVQRSAAEQHQLRKQQHHSQLVHRGEQEVPKGLHQEVQAPGPPPCTSALATGITHGSLESLPEMQVKVQELPAELGSQRRTSSFSATEPCLRQDLTAMVPAPSPAASVRRQQERPSMEARRRKLDTSALQGRNVLLAEDNLINQTVAKKMLCSLGMVVEVAANGLDAVDAVRRRQQRKTRPFDVILMDMAMPVMGGVEATKTIRQGELQHNTPIIAMTANASDKDRDECLDAGMDGFLSKPVLKDRLSEAILSVISGRRRFSDKNTVAIKALERF